MNRPPGLVSWEQSQNLGEIPGTAWTCPIEGAAALGVFEIDGGTVTEEVVVALAGGRRQHLELLRYPEGYWAAIIVDSETGESTNDSSRDTRYAGLAARPYGLTPGTPTLEDAFPRRQLDIGLGEGPRLVSVSNALGETATTIYPLGSRDPAPPHQPTSMRIIPGERHLRISTAGEVGILAGGYGTLMLRENSSGVVGKLNVGIPDITGDGSRGQLTVNPRHRH
jgi:hypothetical protein